MNFGEDVNVAQEFGAKAFALMSEHGVPPHPRNYAIWFAYASGRIKLLTRAIEDRLQSGLGFDADFLDDVYSEFVETGSLADAAETTSRRLEKEMDEVMSALSTVTGHTNKFGKSMRGAGAALSKSTAPADVSDIVKGVITATQAMESRTQELEDRLQQSKREINELQRNLEMARTEALTDQLTGISNRKAFDESLLRSTTQAMETGEELCLMICDIDHFKKFNDTWGHRTGDQVLRLVASCIKANVKGQDTAARYGGEEFAVILPHTALNDAISLGNKIRELVKARELVKKSTGESLGRVTMSLGVAQLNFGEPISEFIERADACLYTAKRLGRDRVIGESAPEMRLQEAG